MVWAVVVSFLVEDAFVGVAAAFEVVDAALGIGFGNVFNKQFSKQQVSPLFCNLPFPESKSSHFPTQKVSVSPKLNSFSNSSQSSFNHNFMFTGSISAVLFLETVPRSSTVTLTSSYLTQGFSVAFKLDFKTTGIVESKQAVTREPWVSGGGKVTSFRSKPVLIVTDRPEFEPDSARSGVMKIVTQSVARSVLVAGTVVVTWPNVVVGTAVVT